MPRGLIYIDKGYGDVTFDYGELIFTHFNSQDSLKLDNTETYKLYKTMRDYYNEQGNGTTT